MDACNGATVNFLGEVTSGSACVKTISQSWDAVDACGNHSATVTQTITVTDNTAPAIAPVSAPSTIASTMTPTATAPTATDACNRATVNFLGEVTSGSACVKTISQSWDAVDACGNHSRSEERRVGKEGRSRWSPDH